MYAAPSATSIIHPPEVLLGHSPTPWVHESLSYNLDDLETDSAITYAYQVGFQRRWHPNRVWLSFLDGDVGSLLWLREHPGSATHNITTSAP